jgi:hypothetical protein
VDASTVCLRFGILLVATVSFVSSSTMCALPSPEATGLSIHLHDVQAIDRGSLSEIEITKLRKGS